MFDGNFITDKVNSEEDVYNASFSGVNYCLNKSNPIELKTCSFTDCVLSKSNFSSFSFTDVTFKNTDLSNCNFESASFAKVKFINCKLIGSLFINSSLLSVSFRDSIIDYSNFDSTSFKETSFTNSSINFVNFDNSMLKKFAITNSSCTKASFLRTNLNGVDLSSDDISGIVVDIPSLEGLKVNINQAVELSKLLGIIIK